MRVMFQGDKAWCAGTVVVMVPSGYQVTPVDQHGRRLEEEIAWLASPEDVVRHIEWLSLTPSPEHIPFFVMEE